MRPDCLKIDHIEDVISISVRENGVTTNVQLSVFKADEAQAALQNHIDAALAWRKTLCAGSVIEPVSVDVV